MKRYQKIGMLGVLFCFVALFAACGRKTAVHEASRTITITGSTSVDQIITDMKDEFCAWNPDIRVTYTGTGSSAGIEDTILGNNTLGVSSRALKPEELEKGVIADPFAYDGIAVVVHPKNKVKDITLHQLQQIYAGKIKNWKELGGENWPIVVVSREGASGTRSAFEELISLEEEDLTRAATVVEGNGTVQTVVAGNKNAIGYVSFSFLNKQVKELMINSILGNPDTVKSGDYVLARPFLFVYKKEKLTKEAREFLDYAKGPQGQEFVKACGGIQLGK